LMRAVTGLPARIKWPNDVVLDDRKIAGVLMEMEAEVDRVHYAIAGIGVNVNLPLAAFPPELRERATSLAAAAGHPIDRPAFTARLLAEFEARYSQYRAQGLQAMQADWEACSSLTDRVVTVAGPDGARSGRVLGIDADGALRLDVGGRAERIVAGEVTLAAGGYAG
jgi:BirA family transcriptional regulator, biotin operon repressor / biotin---[acetyl-CoA-carboxylase] ligase